MPALQWSRATANYGVGTISSALSRIAALSLTTSKLAKKMLFLSQLKPIRTKSENEPRQSSTPRLHQAAIRVQITPYHWG
jgi:hypothetical protein